MITYPQVIARTVLATMTLCIKMSKRKGYDGTLTTEDLRIIRNELQKKYYDDRIKLIPCDKCEVDEE